MVIAVLDQAALPYSDSRSTGEQFIQEFSKDQSNEKRRDINEFVCVNNVRWGEIEDTSIPLYADIIPSFLLVFTGKLSRYVRTLPVGAKNNKHDRLSGTIGIGAGNDDFSRVSSLDKLYA